MKHKEQIIYDLSSQQFRHLQRSEDRDTYKVDINHLIKGLNQTKRSNFYNTALFVVFFTTCLIVLSIISIKF